MRNSINTSMNTVSSASMGRKQTEWLQAITADVLRKNQENVILRKVMQDNEIVIVRITVTVRKILLLGNLETLKLRRILEIKMK